MQRCCILVGLVSFLCASLASAQAPTAPTLNPPTSSVQGSAPATPPPSSEHAKRLEEILLTWETEAKSMQNVYMHFIAKKKYNNLDGREKYFNGEAKFMHLPANTFGANIRLYEFDPVQRKYKQDQYEQYILTGGFLYTIDPVAKEIIFQTLPQAANRDPAEGPMPFSLFLMRSETIRKRFHLQVIKIDQALTYLEVRPKFQEDMQDFTYARICIMNQGHPQIGKDMPRELYWIEPNKTEVKWDIQQIGRNVGEDKVNRNDFVPPKTPPGWKLQQYQPTGAAKGPAPTGGTPTSRKPM